MDAIIEGVASPQVIMEQIPVFARFLLLVVEFITPLLYAWSALEATREVSGTRTRSSRSQKENFDFIIGEFSKVSVKSGGGSGTSRATQNFRIY